MQGVVFYSILARPFAPMLLFFVPMPAWVAGLVMLGMDYFGMQRQSRVGASARSPRSPPTQQPSNPPPPPDAPLCAPQDTPPTSAVRSRAPHSGARWGSIEQPPPTRHRRPPGVFAPHGARRETLGTWPESSAVTSAGPAQAVTRRPGSRPARAQVRTCSDSLPPPADVLDVVKRISTDGSIISRLSLDATTKPTRQSMPWNRDTCTSRGARQSPRHATPNGHSTAPGAPHHAAHGPGETALLSACGGDPSPPRKAAPAPPSTRAGALRRTTSLGRPHGDAAGRLAPRGRAAAGAHQAAGPRLKARRPPRRTWPRSPR